MKEAEERRAPFQQHLTRLNDEFYENQLSKVSDRTARKHTGIIGLFIDFICGYTDVESIEEITRGMVNTNFKQWWKRKVWDSTTPDQLTVALRKFFTFLATEKGIVNEKAMKGLQ
jgi:hypothetical protein